MKKARWDKSRKQATILNSPEGERETKRRKPTNPDESNNKHNGSEHTDCEASETHHFSLAKLSDAVKGDYTKAPIINLTSMSIGSMDDLAPCKALQRIDIGCNSLEDLTPFKHCHDLKWLNVQQNRITSISDLHNLRDLAVLNVSHNQLTEVADIAHLGKLKALILNNNSITTIEGLSKLSSLETLILSHNRLEEFPTMSKGRPLMAMKKLSLGNNKLVHFPSVQRMPNLQELRLNSNKIGRLSDEVATLGRLKILDMGNNRLLATKDLTAMNGLVALENLNLNGNKVTETDAEGVQQFCAELPKLVIFNSRRLLAPQPKAKQKRRPNTPVAKQTAQSSPD